LIAKGVRLLCTNTVGKNSKMVVLRTQGSSSVKDNIITVFGLTTFRCLEPFSVTISDGCRVEGFLSKPGPGTGRTSGDRQFFYVNGRPVDMPKVTKLVNELYRSSNGKQCPVAILDFCIPTTSYDVNVAPDKRKIFFSSEGMLLRSLREAIENLYSPQQYCFSINHIEDPEKEGDRITDGHNEDTNLTAEWDVSSHNDDEEEEEEETDSEDEVSPENKKLSSWIPSFSYEQAKRLSKEGKRYASGASHFRNELAAKSSNIVQSSLMNFVSINKQKNEDDCNLVSEAPLLRRGTYSGKERITRLEENFVSVNKRKLINDCNLVSETPVLRRRPCSEQENTASLEENFVSQNKQKLENNYSLISETPVLRPGPFSEQVNRTSLEANSAAALSSSIGNIPGFNMPQETRSLQQTSSSLVSGRTDVSVSPEHSKPSNVFIHGMKVPQGPYNVQTIESDMVSNCFAVKYADLPIKFVEEIGLVPLSYFFACLLVLDTPLKCFLTDFRFRVNALMVNSEL
jgi:DNA mismatch repair protein PMS2